MEIKEVYYTLKLDFEEARVLNKLLGGLSRESKKIAGLEVEEIKIADDMYSVISAYFSNEV